MILSKRNIKIIVQIVFLTTLLTLFFYVHETLPKPIRAATALIETPVAIASGVSHYFNTGVKVYETPWAIILTNFLFSVLLVLLVDWFINKFKSKQAL